MKKESERITELEKEIRNHRSKSYRYEKQIGELQEELFDCYDNLDELNGELDELRSHHDKLKNHWLVKLLRL